MNFAFAVLAALMAGAALAFLLWPLLRKSRNQADHQGGDKPPAKLGIGMSFLLPVAALGMYMLVGTPQALNPEARSAPQVSDMNLADAVARLQTRLEASPGDLQGWTLLARARQAMGQPDKAAHAWQQALKLAPDNAGILVANAEARSLADPEHHIDAIARGHLIKALQVDPDNERALWLKGISDYQLARYRDAAQTWQTLLTQVDASARPEVATGIRKQIQRAREAAGMPAAATSTAANAAPEVAGNTATAASPAIPVRVSLAPSLAGKADPDSTVFVYAQAPEGPPAPLAIKRLRVTDLPAEITLTDAMAMLPSRKLSTVAKVEINARISASGQATPQPGDIQATAVVVKTSRNQPVNLVIDHVL